MKYWISMLMWLSGIRETLNEILDQYAVGGRQEFGRH